MTTGSFQGTSRENINQTPRIAASATRSPGLAGSNQNDGVGGVSGTSLCCGIVSGHYDLHEPVHGENDENLDWLRSELRVCRWVSA